MYTLYSTVKYRCTEPVICYVIPSLQIIPNYQIMFGPKFDQWGALPTERSTVLGVFMTAMTSISVFVGPLGQVIMIMMMMMMMMKMIYVLSGLK